MQKEVLVLSALMLVGGFVSCGGNQQQDKKRMKQEMTTESNDTIMKQFTKENLYWVREPKRYLITDSVITIETEPNTDLWQRTYYGFSNDNAPVLQMKTARKYFSFTVKRVANENRTKIFFVHSQNLIQQFRTIRPMWNCHILG